MTQIFTAIKIRTKPVEGDAIQYDGTPESAQNILACVDVNGGLGWTQRGSLWVVDEVSESPRLVQTNNYIVVIEGQIEVVTGHFLDRFEVL